MLHAIKHLVNDPRAAGAEARWAPLRRPEKLSDAALNGTARQWLRRLPPRRRPLTLCRDFPRVANRIAWIWNDPALSAQALDDLITDRRGGREGFPAAVVRELQRLREFNAAQRVEPAREDFWTALGRAIDGG